MEFQNEKTSSMLPIDSLGLSIRHLIEIGTRWELAINEVAKEINDYEIRVFPSLREFQYWMLDGSSEQELQEIIVDGREWIDEDQYITLHDGQIAFRFIQLA